MESLLEFIDRAYIIFPKKYRGLKSVRDFISKDEECLRYIYNLLDLGTEKGSVLNRDNFNRASHIIVTFLMGLGITQSIPIINGVNVFNTSSDNYLWMLTSLLHDYGYFRNELLESKSLDEIERDYDLLTDLYDEEAVKCLNNYSVLYSDYCTFSYDTIKHYYEYKRNYTASHTIDENGERNDHGIIGACLAFSKYVKFFINNTYPELEEGVNGHRLPLIKTEPLLYKTACMIAAQHNLFKSGSKLSDVDYRKYNLDVLLSTSPILIDDNNPLLLLLSIVDTIECSKRFSKKTNPKKYLQTMTILDNIYIEVKDGEIIVDFTRLNEYIQKRKDNTALLKQIESHIRGICELGSWTNYESTKLEEYKIVIKKKK